MFGVQHLHSPLPGLGAQLFWMKHAPCLLFRDQAYLCKQLPSDHQAMEGLIPVLLGLLSAGGSEVLLVRVQGILHQHPMAPCLPGIQPLLNPPTYCLGYSDVTGLLQDHRLKDDELLQVPLSFLHHQGHHEASPNLPAWRAVAP